MTANSAYIFVIDGRVVFAAAVALTLKLVRLRRNGRL